MCFSCRFHEGFQRSNYSEPSLGLAGAEDEGEAGGSRATKGRARQALSDKRAAELGKKKKSTMNVRTAVLYKKSFAVLLEESASIRVLPRNLSRKAHVHPRALKDTRRARQHT